MDPQAAAMRTKKYLFDYQDLTDVEKGLLRRVVPFWTWTRKNVPLALETLVTQPGKVSALGKVQAEAEKQIEEGLDRKYVSDFIRDGLGVPMRKGEGGKVEYFLMKGWVPTADLAKIDPQEMFGMLHPALKAPIEQAMNKNVFSGRPIERFPGERGKFLGAAMPQRLSHLLRNIVAVQELDRLMFAEEFTAGKFIGKTLGLRLYSQDKVVQMRGKVYDLQREMGEMKNQVKLAAQKYGAESVVAKQYEERLAEVTRERNQVKDDLLRIDPEALKPKKEVDFSGLLGGGRRPLSPVLGPSPSLPRVNLDALLRQAVGGGRR